MSPPDNKDDDTTDIELEEDLQYSDSDSDLCQDKANNIFSPRLTYKPTEKERMKLVNMFINLEHEVPPQHTIEKTAGTRALRLHEIQNVEKYVTLKTGTFSDEENKLIKKNWKNFCKLHDWDPKNPIPFLQMKLKNKVFFLNLRNRKKFVQFLANGLFDRSLYSVYNRFKVMYEPHKVCRYSESEDLLILNYIKTSKEVNKRMFADLALMLHRTRFSVWRRYRLLKKKMQAPSQTTKAKKS